MRRACKNTLNRATIQRVLKETNNAFKLSLQSNVTTRTQSYQSIQCRKQYHFSHTKRVNSMAAKKTRNQEGCGEEERRSVKINFREFGRKLLPGKFKKNTDASKKGDNPRLSAPIIKLSELTSTATSSQPQLPTTSSSPSSTTNSSSPQKQKNNIRVSSSLRMQPDDRMKMFQRMARGDTLTAAQRMQRERQRDFTLIPGPGRTAQLQTSNQSVDSMLVSTTVTAPQRTSLSMSEDDVEPVFKNSLTNKNVTSAQVAAIQKGKSSGGGGPTCTSTPRLKGASTVSPTISNVRSISESSFCIMTPEPTPCSMPPNLNSDNTIYYSAVGLSSGHGRDTPSSCSNDVTGNTTKPRGDLTVTSSETPTSSTVVTTIRVKEEVTNLGSESPHCPSMSSTPTDQQMVTVPHATESAVPSAQHDHLNNLWNLSRNIRDRQLSLERNLPLLDRLRERCNELETEKIHLLNAKGENPDENDLRQMWNLEREHIQLIANINQTTMLVQDAHHWLPILETRRNELLSLAPPTPTSINQIPASFV
uniref:Uncharacterized protein n=1 Tax=Caenorhabditis japonica TaxID=281687 RepID=A0A8R1DHJ4_CAEJA